MGRKWEKLLKAVYPSKKEKQEQVKERGQESDESHADEHFSHTIQLLHGNLDPLVQYIQMTPQKMADIGRKIEKKCLKAVDKQQYREAALSLQLFLHILQSTHSSTLNFYATPTVNALLRVLSLEFPKKSFASASSKADTHALEALKSLASDTYEAYAHKRFDNQLPESVDMAPVVQAFVEMSRYGDEDDLKPEETVVRLHGLRGLRAHITTVDDLDLFASQYVEGSGGDSSSESIISVIISNAVLFEGAAASDLLADDDEEEDQQQATFAETVAFALRELGEGSSKKKSTKGKKSSSKDVNKLGSQIFTEAISCVVELARTSSTITLESLLHTLLNGFSQPRSQDGKDGPLLKAYSEKGNHLLLVLHTFRVVCVKLTHAPMVVSTLLQSLGAQIVILTKGKKSHRRVALSEARAVLQVLRLFISLVSHASRGSGADGSPFRGPQMFNGNVGPAIDVLVPLIKILEGTQGDDDSSALLPEVLACVEVLGTHIQRKRDAGNDPETPEVCRHVCGRVAHYIALLEVPKQDSKRKGKSSSKKSPEAGKYARTCESLLQCTVGITHVEQDDHFGLNVESVLKLDMDAGATQHSAAAGAALSGAATLLHSRVLAPLLRLAAIEPFPQLRMFSHQCLQNVLMLIQYSTIDKTDHHGQSGEPIRSNFIEFQLAAVVSRNGRSRQIRNAAVDSLLARVDFQSADSVVQAGNTLLRLLHLCRAREVSSALCVLFRLQERVDEVSTDFPQHAFLLRGVISAYLSAAAQMFGMDSLEAYMSEVQPTISESSGVSFDPTTFSLELKKSSKSPKAAGALDRAKVIELLMENTAFREEFRSYFGAASAQVLNETPNPSDTEGDSYLDDVDAAAASTVASIGSVAAMEDTDKLLTKLLARDYSAKDPSVSFEKETGVFGGADSTAIPLVPKPVSESLVDLFGPGMGEDDEHSFELDSDSDMEADLELPRAADFRNLIVPNQALLKQSVGSTGTTSEYYNKLAARCGKRMTQSSRNTRDIFDTTQALFQQRDAFDTDTPNSLIFPSNLL